MLTRAVRSTIDLRAKLTGDVLAGFLICQLDHPRTSYSLGSACKAKERCVCSRSVMSGGNTFCTDWDDTYDSFCAMGLEANLLTGISTCAPSLPCNALPVSRRLTHTAISLSLVTALLQEPLVAKSRSDSELITTRCNHINRCFVQVL